MKRINLRKYLVDEERRIVKEALDFTKNNKNQAADLLGMNRSTLVMKLRKLGLDEYMHKPRGNDYGFKWVKVPIE